MERFCKHDFDIDGLKTTVVVPAMPLAGRPWVWRGEFFGAFADADIALVKAGWHLAYVSAPNLFGSPKAITAWDKAYAELTGKYELAKRPGFIGLSRGGLYCMNWAAERPDKTLAVYLDNAVCDFKSWPGGQVKNLGTGKGSAGEWGKMLAAFDFKDDAAAIAYKKNPWTIWNRLLKQKFHCCSCTETKTLSSHTLKIRQSSMNATRHSADRSSRSSSGPGSSPPWAQGRDTGG